MAGAGFQWIHTISIRCRHVKPIYSKPIYGLPRRDNATLQARNAVISAYRRHHVDTATKGGNGQCQAFRDRSRDQIEREAMGLPAQIKEKDAVDGSFADTVATIAVFETHAHENHVVAVLLPAQPKIDAQRERGVGSIFTDTATIPQRARGSNELRGFDSAAGRPPDGGKRD